MPNALGFNLGGGGKRDEKEWSLGDKARFLAEERMRKKGPATSNEKSRGGGAEPRVRTAWSNGVSHHTRQVQCRLDRCRTRYIQCDFLFCFRQPHWTSAVSVDSHFRIYIYITLDENSVQIIVR
jgi:hypothetical protein